MPAAIKASSPAQALFLARKFADQHGLRVVSCDGTDNKTGQPVKEHVVYRQTPGGSQRMGRRRDPKALLRWVQKLAAP